MSNPSPPYYYIEDRTESDVYHWEKSCANNHYPHEDWVKSTAPPSGREQCDQCKAKEE